MAYPDDLLETARHLVRLEPANQASLRRAVSTAYYALFHLLIEGACRYWPESQKGKVTRQFDHKRMRDASARTARDFGGRNAWTEAGLAVVSEGFVHLQQSRHEADYDLDETVSLPEAQLAVLTAEFAFEVWDQIKDTQAAQDYLFSLLFKERQN